MTQQRKKDIRRAANNFREKCKVSRYGILDLFKECERCGYKVIRFPNGNNANLGFVMMLDGEIIIHTNSSSRLSREIFTLAHEIGHGVLHLGEYGKFIDNTESLEDSDEKELEANYFAVSLLMPEDELSRFLDIELDSFEEEGLSALDIARIMTEFNVSFEMTLNTLVNYGKISEEVKGKH